MQGNRKDVDADGQLRLKPGEYGKRGDVWYARPPGGEIHMGSLDGRDVTEHEDGTITVSPSILINQGEGETWHGYLEHGVWREC